MILDRTGRGISSPAKIVANIFISFIGAGLLGLPYAFKESGLLEGALIMIAVGYLSVSAMLMIIDCKYAILSSGGRHGGGSIAIESKASLLDKSESLSYDREIYSNKVNFNSSTDLTYGDIGLYSLGMVGKCIVDIAIIVSQTGFCCGYLIYLCENLKKHLAGLTQGQWLVLLLPLIYGLTLFRNLNKLAIFSIFAQVSNIFALAVVFWFDFSHMNEVSFHPKEISMEGFPFFFSVSVYCYEGAGMILSLEESVTHQNKRIFKKIFVITMIALTILYISFGASGYISYGPYTQQIITLNLKTGRSALNFAALVQICLGVSFFFTYPLMLFPVTHLIDKILDCQDNIMKSNTVRLALVILTGLVVTAIPSFAILASLIGATCCTLLAFILPAVFHMIIFKNRLSRFQKCFDFILIFLGIVGMIIGLWDTFHRLTDKSMVMVEIEFMDLNNTAKDIYEIENFSSPAFTIEEIVTKKYLTGLEKINFTSTDTYLSKQLDTQLIEDSAIEKNSSSKAVGFLYSPDSVNDGISSSKSLSTQFNIGFIHSVTNATNFDNNRSIFTVKT